MTENRNMGPRHFKAGIKLSCLAAFIVLISVAFILPAYGAGGDVLWQISDARTGKQEAGAMAVDSSGNALITGYSDGAGTVDYYTIKTDGSTVLWNKTFDKAGGADYATAVAVDADDNVIVTGYAFTGISYDFHTIKYNGSNGNVLWENTFDAGTGGNDYATAIAVDSIGNIYVGGNSQGSNGKDDYMVIKYSPDGPNPDGTPIWQKSYNGSADGHDRLTAIAAGFDGIAVTGESQNASDFDCVTLKYAFDSTLVWEKRDSASGDDKGVAVAMENTSPGNVTVACAVYNGTDKDIFIAKYNGSSAGTLIGSDTVDSGNNEEPAALVVDSSGNIYVTGYAYTVSTANDMFTAKYDSSVALQWSKTFNSADGNNDRAVGIAVEDSGDIYVTGDVFDASTGDYNFQTLKYENAAGSLLWQKGFDGAAAKDDRTAGIGLTTDGDPVAAGWSDAWTAGASDYDYYALKYDRGLLNAPTDLIAVASSTTQVDLTWSDNSSNEDGFKVERKIGESGTWGEIYAGTTVDETAYSDTPLTPDTKYFYRVRAYNATEGNSDYTNEDYAVTTIATYSAADWEFTFDAGENGDDYVSAISSGADNDPVVTGYSYSLIGQYDYYTVKIDRTDGVTTLWDARFDSDQNDMDVAVGVTVDSNDDVVVTGYAYLYSAASGGNTNDIYSIKYPAAGPPESWNDQYNGPAADDDRSSVVAVSADGSNNYAVVGYGRNADWNDDIYVIKYQPDGTRLWDVSFDRGVMNHEYPSAVSFDDAGDIFVTGYSHNGSNYDYYTRKYSGTDGAEIWTKYYNGAGNADDFARALGVDSNGDVYVTGSAVNASGNEDFVTVKYSGSDGSIPAGWPKIFNGLADGTDEAVALKVDPVNDDVVVAGTALTGADNNEFHVIRYDSAGSVVWERTLDRPASNDFVAAMDMDLSGDIHVAGDTSDGSGWDIISIQYDHEGTFMGGTIYNGSADGDDGAAAVEANAVGEAFIGGYTMNASGDADYIVYKVSNNILQAPAPFTAATYYTQVDLYWSDNSDIEDTYRLERMVGICDPDSLSWSLLQEFGADAQSYVDEPLTIGQDYCYRVRAETDLGLESRWVYRQVTTSSPSPPSGLSAAAVNTTEIDVSWTDTTGYEDGFILERCTGAGCSSFSELITLPAETEAYTDTDVCESESYSYRVKAYRTAHWNTGYSNVDTAVTPSITAPSDPAAVRISEAQVDIKWTDNMSDETGYRVERCVGTGTDCDEDIEFTQVAELQGTLSLLLHMDEASWNGTADEVVDSSGSGNHGTRAGGANTVAGGHSGRAGSFSGNSDYVDVGSVDLGSSWTIETWFNYPLASTASWNTLTRGSSADHQVIVQRSTMLLGTYDNGGGGFRSSGYDMDDPVDGLSDGWHHLAVVGSGGTTAFYIDGAYVGTSDYQSTTNIRSIGNYWGGSQQFGTIDELAVYGRALTADEVLDRFNDITATFGYSDASVIPSNTYNYRVKAYKTATGCAGGEWETVYSTVVSAVTTLLAPDGLTATPVNTTRIDLGWTDNTASETGFAIERCTGSGTACDEDAEFTWSGSVGADVTTYSDTSLCEGTTYTYRVRAESTAPVWQSGWTDPAASGSTPSISAPVSLTAAGISESEIDLEWTSGTTDQTGFRIERCQGNSSDCGSTLTFSEIDTLEPTSGAQLLMAMEEASWSGAADEVIDSSGQGNHGTAYGGATTTADGKYGRAGSFDGSSQYVETGLWIDQTSGTSGVTMEAWVYPTSTNSGRHELISSDNGGYDWSILRNGSVWSVFTGSNEVNTGLSVDIDTWQHVAAVFTPGSGVTFYKNGYEIFSTGTISYDSSDNGIAIARRADGGEYFAGRVDEVAVYNRPLTQQEIEDHYELGIQAQSTKRYRDSGLNPGTTYTYRVRGYKNPDNPACNWETLYSNEAEGATDNVPRPTDLTAIVIDSTTVDLAWTDNTESESKFSIERCEGAACSFTGTPTFTISSADVTSYTDTTACENTTYRYQVRAEKEDGPPNWISDWSDPAELDEVGSGITDITTDAKAAPEDLLTRVVSESEIELNWTDNVADETGFRIMWCLDTGGGCTPDQLLSDFVTSYAETMVLHMEEALWSGAVDEVQDASGNGYHGRAYGGATTTEYGRFGRAGSFDGSNDFVLTSLNLDQSSGSAGVTMEAWVRPGTDTGGWRHVISTDDDSNREWGIAQYNNTWRVLYGNGNINTGFTVDVDQWQHLVAVFTPGVGITFYKDTAAYSTGSISYNTDDRNVTIGRRARDGRWYFNGLIDEVAIYNRPLTVTEVQQLYEQGAQSLLAKRYTHTGLDTNETYRYRVWAYKTASGCPGGEWESGYVEADQFTLPPAPTDLTATKVNTTQIDLAWSEHTADETGFKIERCEGNETDCGDTKTFVEIDTVATDIRTYSDETACDSTEYTYRVKAYRTAEWETGYSNEDSDITDTPSAPTGLSASWASEIQIDLVWTDTTGDETGFKIERCAGGGCSVFAEIAVVGADVQSFSDSGLSPSTSYTYRVKAYKTAGAPACEWTTTSNTATETTAVTEPTVLSASPVNTTQIDLTWADNTASETGFRVLRCSGACTPVDPGDMLAAIGPDLTSYTDDSVCNSTQYTYRLLALKESSLSDDGGACWTRRAPLAITDFERDYVTQAVIAYDPDMQADFSDIRFYDETAGVELPYYFEASSSTAYFKTLGNNNVYMYYGNAGASSASDPAMIFELYDPSNAAYSSELTKSGSNPVLNLGAGGSFDDTHIYGISVIREGGVYKMWYGGHDGASVRIGYATSNDGVNWSKYGSNPVMDIGAASTWEDVHAAYPVVIKDGSEYKMWYSGYDGFNWKIGYATSGDGITWTKYASNPVMELGAYNTWDDNGMLSNSVIREDGVYKMWYSGHNGSNWRIGYAVSDDGIAWSKSGSNPVLNLGGGGGWEDAHVYLSTVIRDNDSYKMWYTGHDGSNRRIGYATSSNGTSWSKSGSNPVLNLGAGGTWEDVHVYSPEMLKDSDGYYRMWYSGHDGSSWRAGYADVRPLISVDPEPSAAVGAEEQDACYAFTNTWSTGYSNSASATTPAPSAPYSLVATSVTDTQTDLEWDDDNPDETGFKVERCSGESCTPAPPEVDTTGEDETAYSDMGLGAETAYCYRVSAYKTAACGWDSGYSNESCDTTFSAAPTVLIASAVNSLMIQLGWTDNSEDEDGFEIEKMIFNGEFVKIATTGTNTTTFTDTVGIEPEKEYTYRIRAFRGADKSPYSNEASATTPAWQEGDDTCD